MAEPKVTPDDEALLKRELEWFKGAEAEHKQFEEQWDHQDRLYFGHKRFRQAWQSSTPRDRDSVVGDARKEFGAELHIPYTFSTIETVMPRTLSNRPRMLFLPRERSAETNAETVRYVCDAQQERMDYELKLQTTVRSGLKHGLGVSKEFWRREDRKAYTLSQSGNGEWVRKPVTQVEWDDPDVEDVDIRDFYWDPYADSVATLRKCLHRSWRDTKYVLTMFDSGQWDRIKLSAEDLKGQSAKQKYSEAWAGRRTAQGLSAADGGDIHEIWEIHDGEQVVTVLNRKWVVRVIENPFWNWRLPFHIYRPVEVEHRFVGVGIIDPIEDLQHELNAMRTDRRWNAMLNLHLAYAYNDGMVDPAEFKIGPGALIPVNGDPRELLTPLNVRDIPNSGYQEEALLQRDIERTTGVDDSVAGQGDSGGAAATATGVQLVQAAAGLRIQAYTRRAELELCKPQAQQLLAMNQQMWVQPREVRMPTDPSNPGFDPNKRWTWKEVGPEQLAGTFDVATEGGSTQPENQPQQRQDAAQATQMWAQNPEVDQRKLTLWGMKQFGIPNPETMLAPPNHVPPAALDLIAEQLQQGGMDPQVVQQIIVGSVRQADQMDQAQAEQQAQPPQQEPQPPQQPA